MGISDFQDLVAWQLVDELRREVIAFTAKNPVNRDFKFCSQIQDAVSSACRNTSEGFGRFRPAENARFIEFAHGSICEVQDLLIEAKRKNYVDQPLFDRLWLLARRSLGKTSTTANTCATAPARASTLEPRTLEPRTLEPRTQNPRT